MANLSLKTVQKAVVDSQIWKSIFRHGYTMNRRNRLLAITNNVFYHILPTKITKYGMRMRFHWGAGIITFYLFLVLTFTGDSGIWYHIGELETAVRWGINAVMYALCLDYKSDQVHIPFILKRRRWSVGR